MTQQHTHARPGLYRRPVPRWWWLEKRSYLIFTLRELTSAFVAWSVLFLLIMLNSVAQGDSSYQDFLDWAGSWWVVVINWITQALLFLHVVTWFDLTRKAMVVQLRGRPVPGPLIVASQYIGLVVVSAFILWLVTR